MRVISRRTLRCFWEAHPDAAAPLQSWFAEAEKASWSGPEDIKRRYAAASFVGERVVFNIGGNEYRLVVWVSYEWKTVYIRFVGTHAEYDRIDVGAI